jgi:hypothetical protein
MFINYNSRSKLFSGRSKDEIIFGECLLSFDSQSSYRLLSCTLRIKSARFASLFLGEEHRVRLCVEQGTEQNDWT